MTNFYKRAYLAYAFGSSPKSQFGACSSYTFELLTDIIFESFLNVNRVRHPKGGIHA